MVSDEDGIIVYANVAAIDLFAAKTKDRLIGLDMIELVHPKDRENMEERRRQILQGTVPPFAERDRLRLDGSEFPSESRSVPVIWDGDPAILIAVRDLTERRRAGAAMRNLGARLIDAHEDERSRIARELHSDLSQSLAILTVDMEQFRGRLPDNQESVAHFLAVQVQRAKNLSSRLQLLSRQLHPSIIDHVGLASAISNVCNKLSERHDLKIDFVHGGVQKFPPKTISLCIYRFVQEGLRNVIKHSGADAARVELNVN
jgi:PAS domain S-box-containing protein